MSTSSELGKLTDENDVFDDRRRISDIVRSSMNIFQAAESLDKILSEISNTLLLLAVVDHSSEIENDILFSNFSSEFTELLVNKKSEKTSILETITLNEIQNLGDVDSQASQRTIGFNEKLRFEMKRQLYSGCCVICIKFGVQDLVFLVGNDNLLKNDHLRMRVRSICDSFITALSVKFRFDQAGNLDNPDLIERNGHYITERQRQCLQWIASGKTSYEISIILGLSEHTVNNYINSACQRMGAVSRAQAVALAGQLGFIDIRL